MKFVVLKNKPKYYHVIRRMPRINVDLISEKYTVIFKMKKFILKTIFTKSEVEEEKFTNIIFS